MQLLAAINPHNGQPHSQLKTYCVLIYCEREWEERVVRGVRCGDTDRDGKGVGGWGVGVQ